jgi:4-hydroxybenzoate polyprenyltransferase
MISRPQDNSGGAEPSVTGGSSGPEAGTPGVRQWAEAWPWLRLLHPFPSLLVTASSVAFAEIAAGGQAPPDRLLRLALSVLCSQCAIGTTNDLADRDLDRATKAWKPVARGVIGVGTAARLAMAFSLACLALSASLSLAALAAAACGLGCGLAYDLRLKRSRWSWLPYGLAIPTLPVWSWAAMGRFSPQLAAAYPLGLLLGLALHLSNTLPDLEADSAHGVAGLAHVLGRRRSQALCWGAMGAAQALTAALAPLLRYHGPWFPVGLAGSLALTGATVVLCRIRPTSGMLQVNFGLTALASLSLACGWLLGAVA